MSAANKKGYWSTASSIVDVVSLRLRQCWGMKNACGDNNEVTYTSAIPASDTLRKRRFAHIISKLKSRLGMHGGKLKIIRPLYGLSLLPPKYNEKTAPGQRMSVASK